MKKPYNCADPMSSGAKLYKKIPTYRVRAKQMTGSFLVTTREGKMRGKAGDYLCEGTTGERWPVSKEIFESTFILANETTRPSTKSS